MMKLYEKISTFLNLSPDVKENIVGIISGESLAVITIIKAVSLDKFMWLSLETLILAIIGGLGGLVGKAIFKFIEKKIKGE